MPSLWLSVNCPEKKSVVMFLCATEAPYAQYLQPPSCAKIFSLVEQVIKKASKMLASSPHKRRA